MYYSGTFITLTCHHHAGFEALAEATVLAAIALRLGHMTVAAADARVHALVLHGALEETFTAAKYVISNRARVSH